MASSFEKSVKGATKIKVCRVSELLILLLDGFDIFC